MIFNSYMIFDYLFLLPCRCYPVMFSSDGVYCFIFRTKGVEK